MIATPRMGASGQSVRHGEVARVSHAVHSVTHTRALLLSLTLYEKVRRQSVSIGSLSYEISWVRD